VFRCKNLLKINTKCAYCTWVLISRPYPGNNCCKIARNMLYSPRFLTGTPAAGSCQQ
jgi:hypothetical protein